MKLRRSIILLITLISVLSLNTFVFADGFSISEVESQATSFIKSGSGDDVIDSGALAKIINPLSGALLGAGTFVILGVGLYLGIKYVMSGPDEKANVKKQSYGVLVSAIVVYGAYGIWKLVYEIVSKF